MPIAQRYSMDEVLDACREYFRETGRRITFEYSLVAGVNDSDEDAKELSSRIHDINCHVKSDSRKSNQGAFLQAFDTPGSGEF